MEYLILVSIGLVAGLFGGLLGIGGAIIMIPALVFAFGENQHLYQAAGMICNFFVGAASTVVHKRADVLVKEVVKWLAPSGILGVVIGVAASNSSFFAGSNKILLARLLGFFMIYVAIYNCWLLWRPPDKTDNIKVSENAYPMPLTILCGLLSGIPAGLLGVGGGTICVPTLQLFLKMPLKKAISNSAATVALMALVGGLYKNLTLSQHGARITESLRISGFVILGAVITAFVGSRLVHKLPTNLIRIIFVAICSLACYKLLTVAPSV